MEDAVVLAAMLNGVVRVVETSDRSDSLSLGAMVMWLSNNDSNDNMVHGEKIVLSCPHCY